MHFRLEANIPTDKTLEGIHPTTPLISVGWFSNGQRIDHLYLKRIYIKVVSHYVFFNT